MDNHSDAAVHLDLLGVHDVDRQVEGAQHDVAVSVAVVGPSLGRGGGVGGAGSSLGPSGRHASAPRAVLGGLGRGSLHQVDHLPVHVSKERKKAKNTIRAFRQHEPII